MSKRTREQIITDVGTKLATNGTGAITAELLREVATDIVDSASIHLSDSDLLTIPTGDATTQYFVFEGDSLTATDTTGDAQPDWNTRVMTMSQFAGRGTRLNLAESGGVVTSIGARYTTYAYPVRPGQNGITKAWYFLWQGTNDAIIASTSDYLTKYNDWKSAWDSTLASAKADGFKIVVFTIMKRPYPATGVGSGFELVRQLQNEHIRHSVGLYDILIDTAQLFPDNEDTTWFEGGFVHLISAGRQLLANHVNSVFAARGIVPYPPDPNAGLSTGTGSQDVPTNQLLTETERAYDAPQYNPEVTLADATTITWNLSTAPVARLAEIGSNKTIAAPIVMRAGAMYTLILPFNVAGGWTITWNAAFVNVPTLNTASYRHNVTRWYCDGTRMIGMGVYSFDGTPPVDPGAGALIAEEFNVTTTGVARTVRGTAPDTLNTPGTLWIAGRGNAIDAGNVASTNPGYATNTGPTTSNCYALGETDHYVQALMRFADATSSGFAGVVFRSVDSNNFWIFGINGAGQWTVLYRIAGSATTVQTGTFTYNDTAGHIVRAEALGNAIICRIDGTAVYTTSNTTHAAGSQVGYGDTNLGSSKARWFNFEAGT